ncbi:MAG: hypothetical protein NTW45_04655 [Rhodocyclales bacterium]|nr:hypothetical protein [Rhodocyclales bacterium]
MLHTLKTVQKSLASHQLAIVMREAAVNVWSANMNVIHVARREARKVFNVLAQRTEVLKRRNVKALKVTVEAANDKVNGTWTAVEKVLDARVIPVLGKAGLASPAQFGVDLVGKGLARVSAQVVELTRVRKAVARKPAAKKMPTRKTASKHIAISKARKAA